MKESEPFPGTINDEKTNNKTNIFKNKRTISIIITSLITGLIIGSIISSIFMEVIHLDDEETDGNPDVIDSDGDGVSDDDEITRFGTDPNDPDDMIVRVGLLIRHQSLSDLFPLSGADQAILISENTHDMSDIIPVECPQESNSVFWGRLILRHTDQRWEVVDQNRAGYEDKNVEQILESSISVVTPDLSIGYGIDDNIVWLSFEEKPALFTDIEIRGVLLNSTMMNNIGIFFGMNLPDRLTAFQGITGVEMDLEEVNFIIAEGITYPDSKEVTGDVLHQLDISREATLQTDPDKIKTTIDQLEYSVLIVKEKSSSSDLWALLHPNYHEDAHFESIVKFDGIVQIGADFQQSIEDLIPGITSTEMMNVDFRFGLITSKDIQNEEYTETTVSSLYKLSESADQVPVSIDCYTLWTKARDLVDLMGEYSGDLEALESLLMSFGLEGSAAIGLMMDLELQGGLSLHTISQSIGFALCSEIDVKESRLMMGEMKGVVHKVSFYPENDNHFPLLITDELDIYDTLVTTSVEDVHDEPLDHTTSEKNRIMIELEGYLVGTTVKTLIDQLDDIPELSLLKIIQYLPHDICVYQLFELNDEDTDIYSIPIIQIVPGKGKTYLGEYKVVQGWYDRKEVENALSDLTELSLNTTNLPVYLKDYIIAILRGEIDDIDLTSYLNDQFERELFESMDDYLANIQNELLFEINGMDITLPIITDLFSDEFADHYNATYEKLMNVRRLVNTSLENITTAINQIMDTVELSIEIEDLIEGILADNLTFDELSDTVRNIEFRLVDLNGSINDLETLTVEQYNNLDNLSSDLGEINSSLDLIHNWTQDLYEQIAEQIEYIRQKTLDTINITTIVDKIMILFFPYTPVPPPPPPGNYSSLEVFLHSVLSTIINVNESSVLSGTGQTTFEDFVRNNTRFSFIDTLNDGITSLMSNISELRDDVETLADNFKNAMDEKFGKTKEHYDSIFQFVQTIKSEIDQLNENRSTLTNLAEDTREILQEVRSNLLSLNTLVFDERDKLSICFSILDLDILSFNDDLEKKIETEVVLVVEKHTTDLITDISSSVSKRFNLVVNDSSTVGSYFDDIISNYTSDLLSFINIDIWNILVTADHKVIDGFVVMYKIDDIGNIYP